MLIPPQYILPFNFTFLKLNSFELFFFRNVQFSLCWSSTYFINFLINVENKHIVGMRVNSSSGRSFGMKDVEYESVNK